MSGLGPSQDLRPDGPGNKPDRNLSRFSLKVVENSLVLPWANRVSEHDALSEFYRAGSLNEKSSTKRSHTDYDLVVIAPQLRDPQTYLDFLKDLRATADRFAESTDTYPVFFSRVAVEQAWISNAELRFQKPVAPVHFLFYPTRELFIQREDEVAHGLMKNANLIKGMDIPSCIDTYSMSTQSSDGDLSRDSFRSWNAPSDGSQSRDEKMQAMDKLRWDSERALAELVLNLPRSEYSSPSASSATVSEFAIFLRQGLRAFYDNFFLEDPLKALDPEDRYSLKKKLEILRFHDFDDRGTASIEDHIGLSLALMDCCDRSLANLKVLNDCDLSGDVRAWSSSHVERRRVAEFIGRRSKSDRAHRQDDLVETLIASCSDRDPGVRAWAGWALGLNFHGQESCVHALVGLTKDPAQAVAEVAFDALAKLGPRARAAVPRLAEILRDYKNDDWLPHVVRVIYSLRRSADPLLEPLIHRIYNRGDIYDGDKVAEALAVMGRIAQRDLLRMTQRTFDRGPRHLGSQTFDNHYHLEDITQKAINLLPLESFKALCASAPDIRTHSCVENRLRRRI